MVPERHSHTGQSSDENISRQYQALLRAADLATRRGLPELLRELSARLHEVFDCDFTNYALYDSAKHVMGVYMLDETLSAPEHPIELSIEDSPTGWTLSHQTPLAVTDLEVESRFPAGLDLFKAKGFRSLMVLPMTTTRGCLGSLGFGSKQVAHYDESKVRFLERIAELVALAIENALTKEAIASEKDLIKLEGSTLVIKNRTALEAMAV